MFKMKCCAAVWILIILTSCTKQPETVVLQAGSPSYELGKQIAAKHPYLDPEANTVLASSRHFRISAGEVLEWMRMTMGRRMTSLATMDSSDLYQLVHQTLTRMSEKKLLLRAAMRSGAQVGTAEVDSIYRLQFRQYGSEARFLQALDQQGIEVEFVRNDIRENMIIGNHLDLEIEKRSRITESEIMQAYEQYRADTVATVRHILLLTQSMQEPEKSAVYRKMSGLLSRARKGEDFTELARQYSEDPGSKEIGGLYENFPRGVMVRPFENAAFTVPVGEISDIVETRYGYHILKVIDRKQRDDPLEQVRHLLTERLISTKRDRIIRDYIKELEDKNRFKIHPFN